MSPGFVLAAALVPAAVAAAVAGALRALGLAAPLSTAAAIAAGVTSGYAVVIGAPALWATDAVGWLVHVAWIAALFAWLSATRRLDSPRRSLALALVVGAGVAAILLRPRLAHGDTLLEGAAILVAFAAALPLWLAGLADAAREGRRLRLAGAVVVAGAFSALGMFAASAKLGLLAAAVAASIGACQALALLWRGAIAPIPASYAGGIVLWAIALIGSVYASLSTLPLALALASAPAYALARRASALGRRREPIASALGAIMLAAAVALAGADYLGAFDSGGGAYDYGYR